MSFSDGIKQMSKDWKLVSSCGNYVYHFSLIDYLQDFSTFKRCEAFFKSIQADLSSTPTSVSLLNMHSRKQSYFISCKEPDFYRQRMVDFFKDNLIK